METAAAAIVAVERAFEPATDLTPLSEAYRASYHGLAGAHSHLATFRDG